MKSSKEELRKRGYADEAMIQAALCLDIQSLLKQCSSAEPWERSAAVYALKQPDCYAEFYAGMLSKEKKLYTRLAICEVLAEGHENTAKVLIHWLGKIGSNQYHTIGKTSMKKSYPLPRDLIARILGRMDSNILPELFDEAVFKDETKLSEALDAIGFMVFYNQKLVDIKWASMIMELLDRSKSDLIRWKAITALSAFPLPEVKARLLSMHRCEEPKRFYSEIERSLKLIDERKEGSS